ncbi:glycosyltransferase family 2 protein [Salipiger sp. HF18]|uniref:glycosyltransferase family 2 protein n=1 Tax=Salipiger sp. HF18 TaxID=2721557 RepID=UPI0020CB26A0|nr:glycosyltransferase family 2 protein [Salipiger sp. HF18]
MAYNRCLGVTGVLICSNDCSDRTDVLPDVLAPWGVAQRPNPASGRNDQMEALRDAQKQELVTRANWIWEADVDAFLNIHAGDGALAALADACGAPQAISLRDQVFANDGVQSFEDRPVIGQFIHSHNPDLWCAEPGIEGKALVQNDFSRHPYGAQRPFFREGLARRALPRARARSAGFPLPVPGVTPR